MKIENKDMLSRDQNKPFEPLPGNAPGCRLLRMQAQQRDTGRLDLQTLLQAMMEIWPSGKSPNPGRPDNGYQMLEGRYDTAAVQFKTVGRL